MVTEQPLSADLQKVDEPRNRSRLKQFLAPVLVALSLLIGMTVGKRLGASYEGFGQISGARVGEWFGFAIGVSIATFAEFFAKSGTRSRDRPIVSCSAIGFLFILSSLAAIFAEANTGELGGPLAFIAFWAVAGAVIYISGKRSETTNQAQTSRRTE